MPVVPIYDIGYIMRQLGVDPREYYTSSPNSSPATSSRASCCMRSTGSSSTAASPPTGSARHSVEKLDAYWLVTELDTGEAVPPAARRDPRGRRRPARIERRRVEGPDAGRTSTARSKGPLSEAEIEASRPLLAAAPAGRQVPRSSLQLPDRHPDGLGAQRLRRFHRGVDHAGLGSQAVPRAAGTLRGARSARIWRRARRPALAPPGSPATTPAPTPISPTRLCRAGLPVSSARCARRSRPGAVRPQLVPGRPDADPRSGHAAPHRRAGAGAGPQGVRDRSGRHSQAGRLALLPVRLRLRERLL